MMKMMTEIIQYVMMTEIKQCDDEDDDRDNTICDDDDDRDNTMCDV
jgi:hypothetical protein